MLCILRAVWCLLNKQFHKFSFELVSSQKQHEKDLARIFGHFLWTRVLCFINTLIGILVFLNKDHTLIVLLWVSCSEIWPRLIKLLIKSESKIQFFWLLSTCLQMNIFYIESVNLLWYVLVILNFGNLVKGNLCGKISHIVNSVFGPLCRWKRNHDPFSF